KYIGPDGVVLDWKIEITANIFGEMTLRINGDLIEVQQPEDLDAIMSGSQLDILTPVRPGVTFVGHYIFNGKVRHYDAMNHGEAKKRLLSDLSVLKDIVGRANSERGAYKVNDNTYPFSGLRGKLQARRKVARIHGSRALGGRFWENEEFETVADDGPALSALHFKLIERLGFFDVKSSSPQRTRVRRNPDIGIITPETDPEEESPSPPGRTDLLPEQRQNQLRTDALEELEKMRLRKSQTGPILDGGDRNGSSPRQESQLQPIRVLPFAQLLPITNEVK
ncbi:MAG: hypothetical protein MI861_28415, partial [Pirellulales bacterium]|nr:hypothetical protein [Pirellulales bacterium]